jgi:hypothetical protein
LDGHIWCRNCLLKHFIEGKIEGNLGVMGRGRRRSKKLLDDVREKRGHWKFERSAQDPTLWRTHSGRDCGTLVDRLQFE